MLQAALDSDPAHEAWEAVVPAGGWLAEASLQACFDDRGQTVDAFPDGASGLVVCFGAADRDPQNTDTFTRVEFACRLAPADVGVAVVAQAALWATARA